MHAMPGKSNVPTHNATILFTPIQVGSLLLTHRVVMAPLTRLRAQVPGDIPVELMAEYYGQRASPGGLIISEGTTVSVGGRGYLGAPGIYSLEQVAGWSGVTESVHAKGGYIFAQLWHVGRSSHVDMTNGETPVCALCSSVRWRRIHKARLGASLSTSCARDFRNTWCDR